MGKKLDLDKESQKWLEDNFEWDEEAWAALHPKRELWTNPIAYFKKRKEDY